MWAPVRLSLISAALVPRDLAQSRSAAFGHFHNRRACQGQTIMSSMFASHTSNITGGTFTLVNGDMHYHGSHWQGAFLTKRFPLWNSWVCEIGRKLCSCESGRWGPPSVHMSFLSRCGAFCVVCWIADKVCHWFGLLSVLVPSNVHSFPKTSFQVSIGWEGTPPGVRICVKKILAKYNRSCILQVDTKLEMAEGSGKGHAFATVLPGGIHE